jgi:sirohydrochlorin cobaltochelatase
MFQAAVDICGRKPARQPFSGNIGKGLIFLESRRRDTMKKNLTAIVFLTALGLLTACGGGSAAPAATPAPATTAAPAETTAAPAPETTAAETTAEETTAGETAAEEEEEENYDTGDASLDDPRNGDDIGEKELLVVSFGTSFNDSRRETIGAIEEALQEAFPDWSVRRAFTSQIIIDHVEKRDGEVIDNVGQALDRAVKNGVKTLVVQPTHLMNGLEYTDLENEIAQYADGFEKIVIGKPLLTTDEDFSAVADAIVKATEDYDDGETAICFMGHGTEAESNGVYAKMQDILADKGMKNYYIGTVEAKPDLEDVLAGVAGGSYKKVVLEPLMVVAGDHANNDMAGDEEGSWKSEFEKAGYEVACVLRGLGEIGEIRKIYVQHAEEAIQSVK